MPELMTKQDAIEYLLYMKHDVQAKSPMDIALDTAIEALKQTAIEPEVLLIPKEVSATDIDKLTEIMIKGSLLQAYPNDVMFAAVRHGRWIPTEYDSYADGAPVWDKWECSECGHEHSGEEDTLTAFCPGCGADMRESRGVDNDT